MGAFLGSRSGPFLFPVTTDEDPPHRRFRSGVDEDGRKLEESAATENEASITRKKRIDQ